MRATVLVNSHPLLNYRATAVSVRRRRKIANLAPRVRHPFIALLNGKPILRVAWGRRLRDGDELRFYIIPQGGGGGGGSETIFDSFFGFDSGGADSGERQGASKRMNLTISFEEAVSGVEKEASLNNFACCNSCNGTGATNPS
ncbi:MAG: hypothetical protein HQL86_03090, partial [Magnetococcales bacterium]|nr:hypothetical protein [Magnetococcales bacterium]